MLHLLLGSLRKDARLLRWLATILPPALLLGFTLRVSRRAPPDAAQVWSSLLATLLWAVLFLLARRFGPAFDTRTGTRLMGTLRVVLLLLFVMQLVLLLGTLFPFA